MMFEYILIGLIIATFFLFIITFILEKILTHQSFFIKLPKFKKKEVVKKKEEFDFNDFEDFANSEPTKPVQLLIPDEDEDFVDLIDLNYTEVIQVNFKEKE
jgi:hypothetical protein